MENNNENIKEKTFLQIEKEQEIRSQFEEIMQPLRANFPYNDEVMFFKSFSTKTEDIKKSLEISYNAFVKNVEKVRSNKEWKTELMHRVEMLQNDNLKLTTDDDENKKLKQALDNRVKWIKRELEDTPDDFITCRISDSIDLLNKWISKEENTRKIQLLKNYIDKLEVLYLNDAKIKPPSSELEPKLFIDYLNNPDKEKLLKLLHSNLDDSKARNFAKYILALRDLQYLDIPSPRTDLYASMRAEFVDIGATSGMNSYLEDTSKLIKPIEIERTKTLIEKYLNN